MKVLIAVHEEEARQHVRQVLDANAAIEVVEEASTATEAIGKAESLSVDVVLVGTSMSEGTSLEIIRTLHEHNFLGTVVVFNRDVRQDELLKAIHEAPKSGFIILGTLPEEATQQTVSDENAAVATSAEQPIRTDDVAAKTSEPGEPRQIGGDVELVISPPADPIRLLSPNPPMRSGLGVGTRGEGRGTRRSALDSDKWGRWRPLVGVGGADGGPGQRRWGGVGGTACKGRQSRTGPVRLCGVVE